jgi:hypothetical protein
VDMNTDESLGTELDPALEPVLEQFYAGAEDDEILRGLQGEGYTQAEAQRMLTRAERIFEALPQAADRRNFAQRGLAAVAVRFVRQSTEILDLVRAGDAAEASWQCLSLSWSALGYFLLWSMVVVVGMMAYSLLSTVPAAIQEAAALLVAVASLLPLVAVLTAFASSLFGTTLGLLGLLHEGHRRHGGAGFILNGLLLGLMLSFGFLSYAALG